MTCNIFIECPICGAVTRVRAPAGYIYSTPVRIHCGECDTLLTGEFISDNKCAKAYFKMSNCSELKACNYDFYAEASGEMPCNKSTPSMLQNGESNPVEIMSPPKPSPVFRFMESLTLENRTRFINFACYSFDRRNNWDKGRIKYDLFLRKNFDLIKKKFSPDAMEFNISLLSEWDVIRYIFVRYFYENGGIFRKTDILATVRKINYTLMHMDRKILHEYVSLIDADHRLVYVLTKLFGIMFAFTNIFPFVTPAISATQYEKDSIIDFETEGISTCSFSDIKNFYIDAYEDLVGCSDLVVALDNILYRTHFDAFNSKLTLKKYREQSKGNQIKILNTSEFFSSTFHLPVQSGSLRNAIGHHDYNYCGSKQEINYAPKTGTPYSNSSSLLEVAMECCYLMQSSYILTYIVYELYRLKYRNSDESVPMHPNMYLHTKSQSLCPCGSQKKYGKCCKDYINKLNFADFKLEYPNVADTGVTIPDGIPISIENVNKLFNSGR